MVEEVAQARLEVRMPLEDVKRSVGEGLEQQPRQQNKWLVRTIYAHCCWRRGLGIGDKTNLRLLEVEGRACIRKGHLWWCRGQDSRWAAAARVVEEELWRPAAGGWWMDRFLSRGLAEGISEL